MDQSFNSDSIATVQMMDFAQMPMEAVIRYARKMHLLPAKLSHSVIHGSSVDSTESSANNFFDLSSHVDALAIEHYSYNQQDYQKLVDICNLHYRQIDVTEKEIVPWFVYCLRNRDKVLKLKPPATIVRPKSATADIEY